MIFIKPDSVGNILLVHNMPFDNIYGLKKSREELEKEGFFVNAIPIEERRKGKTAVLKCDVTTKALHYEYVDEQLTPQEEFQLLKQENDQPKQKNTSLEASLLEMTAIAAQQEQRIVHNEQAILELTTLIAGGTKNV
jgi:hypothetical protein